MKFLLEKIADYIGILPETLAIIITTLFVFIAGLLVNTVTNKISNYHERKSYRSLAKLNLKNLLKDVYRQAHDFDFFKKQLNIEYTNAYHFKYRMIPALAVFREMGYKNLYNAYFKGIENSFPFNKTEKLEAFNSLWRVIEYTEHTIRSSQKRGKEVIHQQAELNELHNNAIGRAQQIIEEFRLHFNGQLGVNEPLGRFYNKREQIIEKWGQLDNKTAPFYTNKYMTQMLDLNRNNVELARRYNSDIKSVELNGHILESFLRYDNMSNNLISANKHFEILNNEYINNFKSLKSNYRILHKSLCPSIYPTMKRKSPPKLDQPPKKRLFYFDGKFEIGHLITIIAVIIAFLALKVSERDLNTKVVEMQKIIDKLNEEELERLNLEVSSLNNHTYGLNHTNNLWMYVRQINSGTQNVINNHFLEISLHLKEVSNILSSNQQTTTVEKNRLAQFLELNALTIQINDIINQHSDEVKQFEVKNQPDKSKLETKKYDDLMSIYNSDLEHYIDSLSIVLNDEINPIANRKKEILSILTAIQKP